MAVTKAQLLGPALGDVISFDADTLHIDGANNRVGIKQSSPTVELDVNGTIKATSFSGPITSPGGSVTVGDWLIHEGDTNTKLGFPSNDKIELHTNGSSRLHIDSNGRVGINDSGQVSYTSLSPCLVVGDVGDSQPGLVLRGSTTSKGDISFCDNSGAEGDDGVSEGLIRYDHNTDRMEFHTADAEKLRITSAGKIVAGNSGTTFGNAAIQAFIAHGSTAGESGFSSVDTTSVAAGVGGEIAFHGKFNTGAQDYAYFGHIRGTKENATAGNTACALKFFTRPNATAPIERLRITSGGNVIVNTNDVALSGSGTLRINSGSTSGELNLDGGATNHGGEINLLGGSNGGRILFRTGQGSGQQGEKMRLDETGNLHLRSAAACRLVLGSSGGSAGTLSNNENWIRGSNTNMQCNTAGGFHAWEISGGEKMKLDTSGNLELRSASQTRITFGSAGGTGNDSNWIRGDGDKLMYNCRSSGKFEWEIGGSLKMSINSDGEVKIGGGGDANGIHNLAKVLELSGGDGGDLIIGNDASSNVSAGMHIGSIAFKNIDSSTGSVPHFAGIMCKTVDTSGNMDLRFYTGMANLEANTPQFTMLGSKLGIGTSSPSQLIHVAGSSSPEILNKPSDATPALFVGDSNRSGAGQHLAEFRGKWNGNDVTRIAFAAGGDTTNKDEGQMMFYTAQGQGMKERFRIYANGRCLIGEDAGGAGGNARLSIDCEGLNVFDDNGDPANYGLIFANDPTTDKANGIGFFSDSGSHCGGYIVHQDKGGNNIGDLVFGTASTADQPSEKLRILSTGDSKFSDDIWFGGVNSDDCARFRYMESSSLYGCSIEHAAAVVTICEQGSVAQAMVLGDTSSGTNGKVLWGVSINNTTNNPTTGSESGWSEKARVEGNGDFVISGSYTPSGSDDRLKKNKVGITGALSKVCAMEGFSFEWNDLADKIGMSDGGKHLGLSAQTVEPLVPEVVVVNDTLINPDDGTNDYKTIRYDKLVPLLVEAIKDLNTDNDALKARITALESS